MTAIWKPGNLYAPQDVVQPRLTSVVTQSVLTNPDFESGDTGWDTTGGWSVETTNPFQGAQHGKFASTVIMGVIGTLGQPGNNLVRSYDGGLTWTESDIGFQLNSAPRITHAPDIGKWVISDLLSGKIFQSLNNGTTWTEITKTGDAMASTRIIKWISGLSLFFAGQDGGKFFSSPDAINWTELVTFNSNASSIAYDPVGDVLLTDGAPANSVNYSDDGGATWSVKAVGMPGPTGLIWAAGAGLFMCVRNTGLDVATSPDGVAWTVHSSVSDIAGGIPNQLAYDSVQDRWVKVGGVHASIRIEYSDDNGATWTAAATHDVETYVGVLWDADHSLFVTQEGTLTPHNAYTSPDGNVWTLRATGADGYIQHTDSGPTASSVRNYMENDANLNVIPGQLVGAEAFALITGAAYEAHVGVAWYDSGSVLLSISWTTAPLVGTSTGYRRVSVSAQAPDLAATCTAVVGVKETGTSVLFDNVTFSHTNPVQVSEFLFRATQAASGYSDSAEPVWPTVIGNTVVDNEVTWEAIAANRVVWTAFPILVSGATEPVWPTEIDAEVADNTISWQTSARRVLDPKCPNTKEVAIEASKVFAGDKDIVAFSATVNPLDWTTKDDAGYIPFGLNTYGSQDVSALGLYRSNLAIFNSIGFQMWQVDEDPQNFALLDAVPVGNPFHRSTQPVMNDLVFLTEVGVRSMGIAGASSNLAAGQFGKNIDPLVKAKLKAGEIPISLFYPGQGQYWLIFGAEAFVLTMNAGKGDMSWSRYVFPAAITDWTILNKDLYLRSGDKILRVDEAAVRDEQVGDPATSGVLFTGQLWWHYLDFGGLGDDKMMLGFDLVGDGAVTITFGYDQTDVSKVTADYVLTDINSIPGTMIPMPITAPSIQMRLVFSSDQEWEWAAAAIYLQDNRTGS